MKVLVNFIQDRSGSMASAWNETLSGYKQYIEELRVGAAKDAIDYSFSLTVFDTVIETPINQKPLAEVTGEELKDFGPRGMTALYDAVGMTLQNTKTDGFEKILNIIVTDGHENSSREWDKDKLQKAIEAKLSLGNWTFAYLGTQPETWGDAAGVGVGTGSSATFNSMNAGATYKAMASLSNKMSASPVMGTRSFMSDSRYTTKADEDEMVKIGMDVSKTTTTTQTTTTTTTPKTPPVQTPKRDNRRWR